MAQDSPQPILVDAGLLAGRLAHLCPAVRIDLAGAVPLPCVLPLADRFRRWLRDGKSGGLDYMARDPHRRLEPLSAHPWAASLLVFAQRYTDGWPDLDQDPSAGGDPCRPVPWTARVARYARGQDYHEVLLAAIRQVCVSLQTTWPDLRFAASTDTGPYLEREYAWLAGLGFLGKNTCLIHERLGSGLFLGVALTNLRLDPAPPAGRPQAAPLYQAAARRARPPAEAYLSACGSCTRCIEACPTGALSEHGGLDAGHCLATWTIEHRGRTPQGRQAEQGGILFGCDICQAVCPWNRRAAARCAHAPPPAAYAVLSEHAQVDLADLARIEDQEFRRRFRATPLWRCHAEGLRRNAATVAANLVAANLDAADRARLAAGDDDVPRGGLP